MYVREREREREREKERERERAILQVLLIGNAQIRDDVRELLFGPDCAFLPAPPFDAYG